MASTIQLKRGSGAPTSGDLAAGELGLDLTNNKIYSSTNGSDIVEMSVPSTLLTTSTPVLTLNRQGTTGSVIDFRYANTTFANIGRQSAAATHDAYFANTAIGIRMTNYVGINAVYPCDNTGASLDNSVDLGYTSVRWDDIYATNGTIQTSDANEKQDIEALSVAEQLVAARCKNLVRKFKWKSSVAEKGSEARTHFGVIAQDVKAAFEAEGLNASDYGLFIESTWTDDNGVEHTRLGVRYTELFAFIISAL